MNIATLIGVELRQNAIRRDLFYQAMQAVLEVTLDDELELDDCMHNFRGIFGDY